MDKITYIITVLMILSWIISMMLYRHSKSLKLFLQELMDMSSKVKNMDLNARMKHFRHSELNVFSENFNNMVDMLDTSFDQIESKNVQLNSIITSLTNGILVIDIFNRAFLINNPAKEYINCPDDIEAEGQLITDIVKEPKILKFIENNMDINSSVSKEIVSTKGQIFKLRIDPVREEGQKEVQISSIVNIEDITDRKKLENMRTEFAANVSHELKTPLTSIQGFIETLKVNDKNIDPEKRKRFLDIIENEANRLRILINDILLLSSIEGEVELIRDWFDIREVNNLVFKLLQRKAKKVNISLEVDYGNLENYMFFTHQQYFKELLINLITNGIKYNRRGGYVKVIYNDDSENYYVTVEDNGIGISENEIERIFERFYRVSKSRNKDIEGTGLGLAIIKHIVISLNGRIDVESTLGKGSSFKIILPKKGDLSVSLPKNTV
ncbi:sensor histidine kinase [Peptostreptococcus faecalis]|uniref:sensor histidine kinase n=1 Tax=Peptostreptococcus faecalis TaxID=2045015 RepID=UPI001FA86D7F|nr:HAMP domain-containing sensor histidine kinase [Peptostreptococcus faecalis]